MWVLIININNPSDFSRAVGPFATQDAAVAYKDKYWKKDNKASVKIIRLDANFDGT